MEKKLVTPLRDAFTGLMGDGMGTFRIFSDEEICGSGSFSFLVNTMNKGKKGPVHTHDTESCFYILSAKGIVRIKDESYAVGPETVVFVPKDSPHQIEAGLGEDVAYIMIYAPPGPEKQLKSKEKD